MNILIPAAGPGKRMRSLGPKCLVKLTSGETVLARQVRLLRSLYPRANIVVVGGFDGERLRRHLPPGVRLVLNENYETTNVAHSITLGLREFAAGQSVLVVYGDIVFNERAIEVVDMVQSHVIIGPSDSPRKHEVGVTIVDGQATCFSYGLPLKWAHIAFLAGPERALFEAIAVEPHRRGHFGYEILNEVLDRGGSFRAVMPPDLQLAEIDTNKDIKNARLIG